MTYYSLTFLLVFLPVGLLLCALSPHRLRNAVLLALSLVFYALLDAASQPLLAASILFDYGAGLLLHRLADRKLAAKAVAAASAVKTLVLVFACLMRARLDGVALPAGVLVYALSSVGYVVDVYRGEIQFERSLLRFALYNCFFGRIVFGPYVRYPVVRMQLHGSRAMKLTSISTGMTLFIRGVAKRVVLADTLLGVYRRIDGIPARDRTTLSAWLLVLSFALGLYFLLGGYCDCARGLGQMFAIKLPRNVMYPLHVRSVREFVLRFHSTLGEYLRRYVYRSLGGAQYGFLSDVCNTVLWLMLYGAWFGLTPNCVIWGMTLAALTLGEKYLYGKLLRRLPGIFGRVYATLAVFLSFTLLCQTSLPATKQLFSMLFTFESQMLVNDQIIYILSQGYWALLAGLALSFPIVPKLTGWMKRRFPGVVNIAAIFVNVALLGASLAYLIAR